VAPRWFAASIVALAFVAAAWVVGRPLGLGVALVAWTLLGVAAFLVRRRDPWSVIWWLGAAALAAVPPDAAPALAALPPPLAARTTRRIRRKLARADGVAGLNLGRARARRALRVP
jgi:hypothetical protein